MAKRILYNLTLHSQHRLASNPRVAQRWEVEVSPRLQMVNPGDWSAMKAMVREAIHDIPAGSDVLVGGLTQIPLLIGELQLFRLFYVRVVRDPQSGCRIPQGVIPHQRWTRLEHYEIECAHTTRHTGPRVA